MLFNRYEYNKKIVDQYVPQCDNCQRCQLFSDDNRFHFYILSFHVKDWSLIKRRKFKHIKGKSGKNYNLYSECNEYLTSDEDMQKFVWPSYFWYIFKDPDVQRCYGIKI